MKYNSDNMSRVVMIMVGKLISWDAERVDKHKKCCVYLQKENILALIKDKPLPFIRTINS